MKTLAVVICLLVCFGSYGQLSIDSIKTDEDIKAFLSDYGKQHGLNWENVTVGDYKADDDRISKRIKNLDSLSINKWISKDFNNDGKADLVYNSIIDNQRSFFSLTSKKDSGYDYFNLHKVYHNYYPYEISVLQKGTNTFLILNETKYIQKDTGWQKINIVDTLKSLLGGFTENSSKINKTIKFDTLEFQFSRFPLYMIGTGFPMSMSITITKDDQIKYTESGSVYRSYEIEDDWNEIINVDHSMHLLKRDKEVLYELLSTIDLKNMKDSFSIRVSHMDQVYIRLKTGKKEKVIIDEGLEGSYSLRLLYSKMFAFSKRLRTDMSKYFQQNNFSD